MPAGSTTALEVVRVKLPPRVNGNDKVRVPLLVTSPRVEFALSVVVFAMVRGVDPTDETPPPVVCPAGTVMPGAGFNVTVFAGSTSLDWLGVFAPGTPHNTWIGDYKYVPLPRPQIVTMVAPMMVGSYEVRLFANYGPNFVGSCPVQVATGP